MSRYLIILLLALGLSFAAGAATVTVVVNGKSVNVPVITANGKTYLDLAALVKLLGSGASYNAATKKLVIGSGASAAGGGSSAANSGTPQLPGEDGQLGVVYKMGKEGSMYYFRLLSAEFTTSQVVIGDTFVAPKADEKLLLLRFTIQNPNKADTYVRGDYMKMMVVDAMNVNHEGEGRWGDAESKNTVALDLKPAQRIEAYTCIRVPAKGAMPKLMVQKQAGDKLSTLRYDLRDKVKPLAAPFADPADKSGLTALEEVPAELNVSYPYRYFNIAVEKFETVTEALDRGAPRNGGSFLVATLLVKNMLPRETYLRGDYIKPELLSTDGEQLDYQTMLFATANRGIAQDMKPGQEMRVRIYFTVPTGVTPQTLTIKEGDSRTYSYTVK